VEDLNRLKQLAGLPSYEDVLNNALSFMEWAVGNRHQGRVVVALDKETGEYRELDMKMLRLRHNREEGADMKGVAALPFVAAHRRSRA
jgi:hypothetical protein